MKKTLGLLPQRITTSEKGFTLIELLVVITVIGILAGLIVTNFSSARERARDTKRKSDLRTLKTALRLYYNDYQRYPNASGGQIQGCGANGTSTCPWGSGFSAGTTEYLKSLPRDPLNASPYVYTYTVDAGNDGFIITARLENVSDTDDTATHTRCNVSPVVNNQYVMCED